eukprot:1196054-Prorocentrum_minimum.AAC.2
MSERVGPLQTLGVIRLPSCDWFSRGVYTASPPVIGSHAEYILPSLLRLVLTRSVPRGRPGRPRSQLRRNVPAQAGGVPRGTSDHNVRLRLSWRCAARYVGSQRAA